MKGGKRCHRYFSGGWSYLKGQGQYGLATDMQWIGRAVEEAVFVVPKQRGMYAAESLLL